MAKHPHEFNSVDTMRHSAAHVLAAAVAELWPGTQFGVGPVIENGFYYDLKTPTSLTADDLETIETKMREIVARDEKFVRREMPIDEAIKFFGGRGQTYKTELLSDLKTRGSTNLKEDELQDIDPEKMTASIYETGSFVDLCRGPHVASSKEIGVFKLTKLAGAYWRGKAENDQLTRVYGVAFAEQSELDNYLHMVAEAEKRDHRKLGAELDLFTFSDLVGPGLPLFTPKGTLLRQLLTDFVAELMLPYGYDRVWIPHLAKSDLYKTSGHWDKFADDIFHVHSEKIDDEFVLKPMNCPHHTQIYASRPRSYRDLPIRYAEATTCYRDENTGQLQGLTRVRSLTQDDAHIFCTLDQVAAEVGGIIEIIKNFYAAFGMKLSARLSLHDPAHPEKYLGGADSWVRAESELKNLLEKFVGSEYETGVGEAAFYGPKIDFMAHDAIGRTWQLATAQLDFNQPERFGLEYADSDGTKKRPVMVHRAVLGSIERFMGIIIEHYAGVFPVWLAPVQVKLLPVADKHNEAARAVAAEMRAAGVRVEVDEDQATIGAKVRKSETEKVPYSVVFGDKEAGGEPWQIRAHGKKEMLVMSAADFKSLVLDLSKKRA